MVIKNFIFALILSVPTLSLAQEKQYCGKLASALVDFDHDYAALTISNFDDSVATLRVFEEKAVFDILSLLGKGKRAWSNTRDNPKRHKYRVCVVGELQSLSRYDLYIKRISDLKLWQDRLLILDSSY